MSITAILLLSAPVLLAQMAPMPMMEHAKAKASTAPLTVHAADQSLALSLEDFAKLPHKTISVHNAHSKADESYSGVLLSDLLEKVNVKDEMGSKAMSKYIITTGADGYRVVYSVAEVLPKLHTGDVLVADSMNGKPLGEDGQFKLISSEDKRPYRWVRNLVSIEVVALAAK
jgi:hypothetical protein